MATGEDLEFGLGERTLEMQGSLGSLAGEANHLSPPKSKKQRQIDALISSATTFINQGSAQDKELFKFIDNENEDI
eukprot:CAMPEP_0170510692 /NCGR_PEP_ID=MMETSP0208-20121228/65904_1 /TAXON_ID=197538 /ORGANISM="Strombidium inclinatum, Strain S3" /LENGTH=75 /DNA_ID=CAMNT_0010794177 /DNA_START=1682 /DNA_END=1909 /DNA_ORIENTATION=+